MATTNPPIVVCRASRIPEANTSKLTFPDSSICEKDEEIPITVPKSPSNIEIELMVGSHWSFRSRGEKNKETSSSEGF